MSNFIMVGLGILSLPFYVLGVLWGFIFQAFMNGMKDENTWRLGLINKALYQEELDEGQNIPPDS